MPQLNKSAGSPLYHQLYIYLKSAILNGEIQPGERLPSLRSLANSLGLSITTVDLAYKQLSVEGYITSRPQSGYYASDLSAVVPPTASALASSTEYGLTELPAPVFFYDATSFDFQKWKKCFTFVLNEHSNLLLHEGEPQGELPLRNEIVKYLYQSRGIVTRPDQIVIGAGMQQITGQLCTLLTKLNINHVVMGEPEYPPVHEIFVDRRFSTKTVPVASGNINTKDLPGAKPSALYVSPSNLLPYGDVMPVANRYALLNWAAESNSYILEDDYDSELRYLGKPVPPLLSLDHNQRVVYFGSFSSTLFPSIKISYMVLPEEMSAVFSSMPESYTQTCSKTEQLTLAVYMARGFYKTNIKKLRSQYSQKLQLTKQSFYRHARDFIRPLNTMSGLQILLEVDSKFSVANLCKRASELGLSISPVPSLPKTLSFQYFQVPIEQIDTSISQLASSWRTLE